MTHVYVIHLEHRKDRKTQFLSAWKKHKLPLENLHWFSAVNGATLSDSTLASFRTVAKTRRARAGRVGCYTSHVQAIEQAIRNNHFPLLILEDDVIPADSGALTMFQTAPSSSTLLYFGALPVKNRKRVSGKAYCSSKKSWQATTEQVRLYGGHAYGFRNRDAAEEVLQFLKKNRITLDSALIRYTTQHRDRVFVMCPFQFFQAEGYSNIEGVMRPGGS